jgi:predicted amidohydrolase YtcJ
MPHPFALRRLALVALAGLLSCRPAPSADPADLVVYGRVWTGDSARPWADAVAVASDTISAVGDSAEIARLVGAETEVLSNGEALVTPGFMDGHVHFLDGGMQLASLDLRDADSPESFTRQVKEYVTRLKPGEWVLGGNWDHESWPGAPLPERRWIDSITPDNPLFLLRLDGHMAVANTAALRAGHVTRATPEVPGGTIVRDRRGEPTGVLKDEAMNLVFRRIPAPKDEQNDSAVARALSYAASKGVTAVATVYGGAASTAPWAVYGALRRLLQANRLTARVHVYGDLADWRGVADSVRQSADTNRWLRLMGVKGFVDGSLGSTTALFYRPYEDAPQSHGLFVTPEDSLRAWIGAADSAGLQVAVHAIGERANGVLLQIFDSVAQAHGPRDRRFRIEHAQHLRREDIGRFGKLGVIASMQPYHAIDDGRWAEKRIGPERIKTTYAFRSLLDQGAVLAFGSDWTVAPISPILGIYSAVTRRTLDGKNPQGWVPEEKISVEEALRAYTMGNAYSVFAEDRRGRLAPGYLADLVLVDRDLTRIPPEEIEQATVKATVVGGRVVFSAPATATRSP